MAPSDRDVILARRALMLGAALGGMALAPRAQADVEVAEEPCAPAEPPSQAALEEATQQFRVGSEALELERYDEAERAFRRAFELSGQARVLSLLARVAEAREDMLEARRLYRRVAACVAEPRFDVDAEIARVEAKLARVTLLSVPEGAHVEIDGTPVADWSAPLEVNPGVHVLRVVNDTVRHLEHEIVVKAGDRLTLSIGDFPPDCDAHPALCMPCLSPPPPPPVIRTTHFGVELGEAAWLDMARGEVAGRVGHGARLVPFVAVPLSRAVRLRLGGFAAATWTPAGDFYPLGGDAQVALGAAWWQMGLGVSGGCALSSVERPSDDRFVPRRGVFVEPYVQALGVRLFEPMTVGLRFGHHLGTQANRTHEGFGLSFVNVGVWVSVALTSDCEDDYGCPKRGIFDDDDGGRAARAAPLRLRTGAGASAGGG